MEALGHRVRAQHILEGGVDVIRLRPWQKKFMDFRHELLDTSNDYKLTDEQFAGADRHAQILSRMWVVRRVVGRFLYHWPVTEIWLDDMASVGLEVISEFEDLTQEKPLLNQLIYSIELMLNDSRSLVRASLITNRRRERDGRELEYGEMESLHNVGEEDDDLRQAELLDELTPEDREKYVDNREA